MKSVLEEIKRKWYTRLSVVTTAVVSSPASIGLIKRCVVFPACPCSTNQRAESPIMISFTISPACNSMSQTCIGRANIVGILAPCVKTSFPFSTKKGSTPCFTQLSESLNAFSSFAVRGIIFVPK